MQKPKPIESVEFIKSYIKSIAIICNIQQHDVYLCISWLLPKEPSLPAALPALQGRRGKVQCAFVARDTSPTKTSGTDVADVEINVEKKTRKRRWWKYIEENTESASESTELSRSIPKPHEPRMVSWVTAGVAQRETSRLLVLDLAGWPPVRTCWDGQSHLSIRSKFQQFFSLTMPPVIPVIWSNFNGMMRSEGRDGSSSCKPFTNQPFSTKSRCNA